MAVNNTLTKWTNVGNTKQILLLQCVNVTSPTLDICYPVLWLHYIEKNQIYGIRNKFIFAMSFMFSLMFIFMGFIPMIALVIYPKDTSFLIELGYWRKAKFHLCRIWIFHVQIIHDHVQITFVEIENSCVFLQAYPFLQILFYKVMCAICTDFEIYTKMKHRLWWKRKWLKNVITLYWIIWLVIYYKWIINTTPRFQQLSMCASVLPCTNEQ